jgi:hypothetical protein
MALIPVRPLIRVTLSMAAAAGLALAAPGCAKPTGSVSGKVVFNGKTVRSGSVMFLGSDSKPHYGQITDEGKYTVEQIPAGPAKITVSSPDPSFTPKRGRNVDDPGVPARGEEARPEVKGWFALPPQYANPAQTPLTFEVKAGTNSHDLELK